MSLFLRARRQKRIFLRVNWCDCFVSNESSSMREGAERCYYHSRLFPYNHGINVLFLLVMCPRKTSNRFAIITKSSAAQRAVRKHFSAAFAISFFFFLIRIHFGLENGIHLSIIFSSWSVSTATPPPPSPLRLLCNLCLSKRYVRARIHSLHFQNAKEGRVSIL